VASGQQLLALGMSRYTISRRRADGTFVPMVPAVVRLASAPVTFEAMAVALLLHCGTRSFVSGVSAAALHGLRGMSRGHVEVTIRFRSRISRPPWATFVGSSWAIRDRDVETRTDGITVATPLRTLFDLAATFNEHRFERAAEDAWHLGLVTPTQADEYLADIRRSGRSGVARFERWLEKTAARSRPSQSGLELDLVDLVRRLGLPEPNRQHPLVLRNGDTIHLDLAWPAVQLALEPGHSWWHGGDVRQRADQARDRACDEVGWRVIRYDEHELRDRHALGSQLRRIYNERLRSTRME